MCRWVFNSHAQCCASKPTVHTNTHTCTSARTHMHIWSECFSLSLAHNSAMVIHSLRCGASELSEIFIARVASEKQCYTAVVAFPCCARCTIAASTIPIQNGQNKWIWCDTKRSDRHGYNAQHTKGIHLMDWRRAIWPTCANVGCEVVAYCGRIEHRIDKIRSRQFTQSNRRLSEMTKGEWHEM